MAKICDHTSVGMFVWRDDKLLLIIRAKPPFGTSVPAGHVDDHGSFEDAARDELREEVGLTATKLELLAEYRKENKCRRDDGSWHYWKMYRVEATGEVSRSLDETKGYIWASRSEIKELAVKTERYLRNEISEDDWKSSPGLEPVMYEWFKQLKII